MQHSQEASKSTEVLVPDEILDPANLPIEVMTKLVDTTTLPILQLAYLKTSLRNRRRDTEPQPEPIEGHLVSDNHQSTSL